MSDDQLHPTDVSNADLTAADHYVLGGGRLGVSVAEQLREAGHAVVIVDDTVDPPGIPRVDASPTDLAALRDIGLDDTATVIVVTRSDRRNLLLAQSIRVHFAEPRVITLANVPDRADLFVDAGHEVVCATNALSAAVADRV